MFLVYNNCRFIEGYGRSVIYDLLREDFSLIPNSLNEYVYNKKGKQFDFPEEEIEIEYVEFLKEKEFIFFIETPELIQNFPELNLDWHYPALISNCIINLSYFNKSQHLFDKVIDELQDKLLCKDILMLSLSVTKRHLNEFLPAFENSAFRSIEIIGNYGEDCSEEAILSFLSNYKRVKNLVLFGAPYHKIGVPVKGGLMGNYGLFKGKFCYEQPVTFNSFRVNITLFTESQRYNSYFNRKIAIDENGYIKNSPELPWQYGSVSELNLADAINDEGTDPDFFKKYGIYLKAQNQGKEYKIDFEKTKPAFNALWFIHKELIDVCKDCEFRHMCVDACVPIQREDYSWYRSEECRYNPYICKWEGEEKYKTLIECGVMCNENGFNIDKKRLEEINETLWTE